MSLADPPERRQSASEECSALPAAHKEKSLRDQRVEVHTLAARGFSHTLGIYSKRKISMETLVLKMLQRLFPVAAAPAPAHPDEQLQKEANDEIFRSMTKWSTILYLPMGLLCCVAWWFGLLEIQRAVAAFYPVSAGDTLIMHNGLYWMIPAMLIGLLTPTLFLEWYQKARLGPLFPSYARYESERQGIDVEKLGPYVLWGVSVACLVFAAFGLNHYVILKQDSLLVSGYWSLKTRVRPLSTITKITTQKLSSSEGTRREFDLQFASGATWSTNNAPFGITPRGKSEMIEKISETTGLPIIDLGQR